MVCQSYYDDVLKANERYWERVRGSELQPYCRIE